MAMYSTAQGNGNNKHSKSANPRNRYLTKMLWNSGYWQNNSVIFLSPSVFTWVTKSAVTYFCVRRALVSPFCEAFYMGDVIKCLKTFIKCISI